MLQIIFLGPTSKKITKKKFAKFIKKASTASDEILETNIAKDNLPSLGILSDAEAFSHNSINPTANEVIIVTKRPLQGNYFSRSNQSHCPNINPDQNIVVVTSFEAEKFVEEAGVNANRAFAATAIVSLYSAKFVAAGNEYWSLWTDTPEDSIFGFCADKSEVIMKFESGKIGARAEAVLVNASRSTEEIDSLKKDANLFRPRLSDRIRFFLLIKNRDVFLSVIFFALGIAASKLFS
ncbi:MAG: hypothetical protein GY892_24370 [Shimia sp.]|nr:hypothetical protein [Shimia sp.]